MKYGLSDEHIRIFKRYFDFDENVIEARLFGSRVDGTYKKHSDIDFEVKLVNPRYLGRLKEGLLNLPTLYKFDVVNYDYITSKSFKDEIDRKSVLFYKRPGTFKRILMILVDDFKCYLKKFKKD